MDEEATQRRQIDIEFCVDCPLHKKYVPMIGNCLELKRVGWFGYLMGGFEQYYSLEDNQSHPASEIVTLPLLSGSKDQIDVFKETKKCQYYDGIVHGLASRTIRSVFCVHPNNKSLISTLSI
jgi:hypothetical protein